MASRILSLAQMTQNARTRGLKIKESFKVQMPDGRSAKVTVKGAPDGHSLKEFAEYVMAFQPQANLSAGELEENESLDGRKRSIPLDRDTLADMLDCDTADRIRGTISASVNGTSEPRPAVKDALQANGHKNGK